MSPQRDIKIERFGDMPLHLPTTDMAGVRLTSSALNAIKPARKRQRIDTEDRRARSQESESSRESGEVEQGQLAPKKKAKRVREKTLRQEMGQDRRPNYKQSSAYTGRGGRPEGITKDDWEYVGHILYLIEKCTSDDEVRQNRIEELRTRLHVVDVETKYNNPVLIKASKILERARGLPRLLDRNLNHKIPWDVVEDARALYDRWKAEKYDSSMLRGILIDKKLKGISYKSDPDYKFQRVPADKIGHNGLVNGQWWPIRQGTLRDGAHGEVEAGIAGKSGKGAFSIVMSNGGYADKDEGDTIYYCGTASDTPTPTNGTNLLRSTLSRHRHPIRVLRAQHKKSIYAPAEGIRYDGLYDIVGEELLHNDTALYRFKLVRVEGQDPIRYTGPEVRPTREEMIEKERVWSTFANN